MLLSVNNLSIYFSGNKQSIAAVEDVTFTLGHKEILGIVGESGCGKSMTSLALLGLLPRPPVTSVKGSIRLHDRELMTLTDKELEDIRGKDIAMIFQEPMTALNPVLTIGKQLVETTLRHDIALSKKSAFELAVKMLASVGISEPAKRMHQYPHELSGGMRQRAMIAMALSCHPSVLIADEPTTALDVTTQAQIFRLLSDIRDEHNMAMILITHNVAAIAALVDRVMVMYAGQQVEMGHVDEVLLQPKHPYTQALLDCVVDVEEQKSTGDVDEQLPEIPGVVPSIHDFNRGCRFAPRCRHVMPICSEQRPVLKGAESHVVACWLFDDVGGAG